MFWVLPENSGAEFRRGSPSNASLALIIIFSWFVSFLVAIGLYTATVSASVIAVDLLRCISWRVENKKEDRRFCNSVN